MADREFCTLFDSNYLIKALVCTARWSGMRLRSTSPPTASTTRRSGLDGLALPHVAAVPLSALEDFDRSSCDKADRTSVEYCWTATPALPLYVFDTRPEVGEVTYIDADLMFFSDPEPLFDEMGDASVLITPHRYAPELRPPGETGSTTCSSSRSGATRTGSRSNWWHDRCIEWCYYRLEDGKLGDQKYLDDWPERFAASTCSSTRAAGSHPGTSRSTMFTNGTARSLVDDDALVFFHYHRFQLRARGDHAWQPPGYPISERQRGPGLRSLPGRDRSRRRGHPVGGTRVRRRLEPAPRVRERIQELRANVGARAVHRFPFLLRVRHPLQARR